MPEAPELEVVREFLTEHAVGAEVTTATIVKPGVLRSLAGDFETDFPGRRFESISRRGKFLLLSFSDDRVMAINPMLTGGIQYCPPNTRVFKRTCLRWELSNGMEMRYTDDKQMGMVYYVSEKQIAEVPQLDEQGPDVLDGVSFEDFRASLKHFPGEIKGILTRGRVLSGIGNAYADEILFAAQIYPFKKRKAITPDELKRLHQMSSQVILDAIPEVRERMKGEIDHKIRDFLKVHNKGGELCPRCGNTISQITANRRITSYCRKCQPGMLLKN